MNLALSVVWNKSTVCIETLNYSAVFVLLKMLFLDSTRPKN